jgi:hypothetical protein
MIASYSPVSRRAARILAALGSALALAAALPALAQQARPTLRHSGPVVDPKKRFTRVTLNYTLPRGYRMAERPRLRIVNAKGRQVGLKATKHGSPARRRPVPWLSTLRCA